MAKVIFKKVECENFMSLGNVELDLVNANLVLVEGKNKSNDSLESNGAGKSNLFEAIYWACKGKTIRGSREVVNRYSGKPHTVVKLTLDVVGTQVDEYVLYRCREHPKHGNNLIITKNGEDISGSGLKKSEQVLETELPFLTEDLMGSVIILGQGLPSRFAGYDPSGRKEILEVLSGNLDVINGMKEKLNNYRGVVSKNVGDAHMKVNRLESAIELRKKDVEELKLKQGEGVKDIKKLEAEISELEGKYENINKDYQSYETAIKKVESYMQEEISSKQKYEYEIKNIQSRLDRAKVDLNNLSEDICPTCGQVVGDKTLLETKKSEIEGIIKNDEGAVSGIEKNIKKVDNDIVAYQSKVDKLTKAFDDCRKQSNELSNDLTEKKNLLQSSKDFTDEIKKYEKEIKDNDSLLYEEIIKLNRYTKYEAISGHLLRELSREFRGYMLGGVIDYLNEILKEMAEILYGKSSLKLVLESNKIEIEYDGREYKSLSGGEQRRADLAIQFALREMLVNSLGFSSNILVLDEITDNLDSNGVEALVRFLGEKLSDVESVFVVTHHSALPMPYDKKITVTKNVNMISELSVSA